MEEDPRWEARHGGRGRIARGAETADGGRPIDAVGSTGADGRRQRTIDTVGSTGADGHWQRTIDTVSITAGAARYRRCTRPQAEPNAREPVQTATLRAPDTNTSPVQTPRPRAHTNASPVQTATPVSNASPAGHTAGFRACSGARLCASPIPDRAWPDPGMGVDGRLWQAPLPRSRGAPPLPLGGEALAPGNMRACTADLGYDRSRCPPDDV